MEIAVKIAADVTDSAATATPGEDVDAVARVLGIELRPMHPGIADPELATYFIAEVGDDLVWAVEAAQRLNELDAVESAYASPAPELPANPNEGL